MNFKKLFISLLVALSLTNVTFAQEAAQEADTFGNVKFGATKEEVKASEKDTTLVLDHNDELIFNEDSEFLGKSQNCYAFDNGKMVAASIYIVNEHQDLTKYLEDYNKVNEAFTQMYGEPDETGFSTEDEALLKDPAKLAKAIKDGTVAASTVWKKQNFTISHILSEKMSTDDMDEESKKVFVATSICHLILGQLNSADGEGEEEAAEE